MSALLVSELRFVTPELAGLDEPAEIFALDPPRRQQAAAGAAAAPWGAFWRGLLEGEALPLDRATGIAVPEEGGFLLRPIRAHRDKTLWQIDARRRIVIPPRSCHLDAGLPQPQPISNELFIEIRYSLPPSLLTHFDFADLQSGAFRAFALPLPDGEVCILLTLDEVAVDSILGPFAPPRKPPLGSVADRFERFLISAAGAPPSAHWASTVEAATGTEAVADATITDGAAASGVSASAVAADSSCADGLFPHQRRSVAWMRAIEDAPPSAHVISCTPLEVGDRSYGAAYEVQLPRGGVLAHPPGAGKTRIGCSLIASSRASTLVLCPPHLMEMWASELAAVLAAAGEALCGGALSSDDAPVVDASGSSEQQASARAAAPDEPLPPLGFLWRPGGGETPEALSEGGTEARVLLLGFHAISRLELVAEKVAEPAGSVRSPASASEPGSAACLANAQNAGCSLAADDTAEAPPSEIAPDMAVSGSSSSDAVTKYESRRQSWLREEASYAAQTTPSYTVLLRATAAAEAPERRVRLSAARLLLDEPQDASSEELSVFAALTRCFRSKWLLCGTASASVSLLGPLLMGPQAWRSATTVDEWRSQPTLPHIFRHRFLRDAEWACLPRPSLQVHTFSNSNNLRPPSAPNRSAVPPSREP